MDSLFENESTSMLNDGIDFCAFAFFSQIAFGLNYQPVRLQCVVVQRQTFFN